MTGIKHIIGCESFYRSVVELQTIERQPAFLYRCSKSDSATSQIAQGESSLPPYVVLGVHHC